jgi:predicted GNAT family N-acyltransferase
MGRIGSASDEYFHDTILRCYLKVSAADKAERDAVWLCYCTISHFITISHTIEQKDYPRSSAIVLQTPHLETGEIQLENSFRTSRQGRKLLCEALRLAQRSFHRAAKLNNTRISKQNKSANKNKVAATATKWYRR